MQPEHQLRELQGLDLFEKMNQETAKNRQEDSAAADLPCGAGVFSHRVDCQVCRVSIARPICTNDLLSATVSLVSCTRFGSLILQHALSFGRHRFDN